MHVVTQLAPSGSLSLPPRPPPNKLPALTDATFTAVSRALSFAALLRPMPSHSGRDGGLPSQGPPRCCGSLDHDQKDTKEQCHLARPCCQASNVSTVPSSVPWPPGTPPPCLLSKDEILQTGKKHMYVRNEPLCTATHA